MSLEIRAIGPDEVDALLLADHRGFALPPPDPKYSRSWTEGELDRTRVAFENGKMVGVSRTYSFEMTMPGGSLLPAAAVSWVSVQPTHRRRGILTQLMNAMHDDARERAEPAAILTASESIIYGRFGYGIATWRLGLTTDRGAVEIVAEADDGAIRLLDRDEAARELPPLYDRAMTARAGMVSRPDYWWPAVFFDHFVDPKQAAFIAVHTDAAGVDDGYVLYQVTDEWKNGLPDRTLQIWDMQAVTPEARIALWQFVVGVDLIEHIEGRNLPVDDPLRHLVADPRRVRVHFMNDGCWLAPLDPVALLDGRDYAVPGRVVIAVHAPDGGVTTLAVEATDGGAKAARTDDVADFACTSSVLGACCLGGNRWTEFAAAGRLDVANAGAVVHADLMFSTTPAPAMLSYF
jgi:predicted acetyltransferase